MSAQVLRKRRTDIIPYAEVNYTFPMASTDAGARANDTPVTRFVPVKGKLECQGKGRVSKWYEQGWATW